MKKTFSKLSSIALAVVMLLSMSTSVFATSIKDRSDMIYGHVSSVEAYENWITSQVNEKNPDGSEAQTFLNEFHNLTEAEKDLFVSYITDPDLILEILNSLFSDEDYVELANGDIVITNTQTLDSRNKTVDSIAATEYRVGTGYKNMNILGVRVFEYRGEIRYSHNGSSITEIQHANIWISANWLPLVDFSWDDESTYGVGTTVAHYIKYCTWAFIHEKLGITVGTHQVEITGSVSNKTTFTVDGN